MDDKEVGKLWREWQNEDPAGPWHISPDKGNDLIRKLLEGRTFSYGMGTNAFQRACRDFGIDRETWEKEGNR